MQSDFLLRGHAQIIEEIIILIARARKCRKFILKDKLISLVRTHPKTMNSQKRLLFYASLVFLCCFFSDCKKKFEEDPKKTTKSPTKRLLGTWFLADYTLNDESILEKMNAQFGNRFDIQNVALTFKKETNSYVLHLTEDKIPIFMLDNSFRDDFIFLGRIGPSQGVIDTVVMKWFILPFKYVPYSDPRGERSRWEITKLFGNELNLRLRNDTGEFKMHWRK